MVIILIFMFLCSFSNCMSAKGQVILNVSEGVFCPFFKQSAGLDLKELVGSWMTVYTQPKNVKCFTLHIRATTDLEREQATNKYGNFSGQVDWQKCMLEVESPLGKHYLQGNGSSGGLLENIIIVELKDGWYYPQKVTKQELQNAIEEVKSSVSSTPAIKYGIDRTTLRELSLQEQSADQWTVFGMRGRELLLMRDCVGEAAAVFARAPYWPTTTELYAVLHRSGVAPIAHARVLCEPFAHPPRQCSASNYFANRKMN